MNFDFETRAEALKYWQEVTCPAIAEARRNGGSQGEFGWGSFAGFLADHTVREDYE